MVQIKLATIIDAPCDRCFDLSRSIDLHTLSAAGTQEKAIAGRTTGLLENGETVTWEAKHFGSHRILTIKIIELQRPFYFKDVMLNGDFSTFEHEHYFEKKNEKTVMKDILTFAAPFGIAGRMVEILILKNYLTKFLFTRKETIRQAAETEGWRKFLPPSYWPN